MGKESAVLDDAESDLGRARAGDDAAFARIVAPVRRELHAHCYRMLGSVHDADDALQDALVRAWKGLAGFEGRSSLRSWLHTVATRTCLDVVEGRRRRALPMDLGPPARRRRRPRRAAHRGRHLVDAADGALVPRDRRGSVFARAVPLSGSCGTWWHRTVEANGQPAAASWLDADGSGVFGAWSIDVLGVEGDRIAGITSFVGTEHFVAFGLPTSLPAPEHGFG